MSRPSLSGAPFARAPCRAAGSRSPQSPPPPRIGFRTPGSSHPLLSPPPGPARPRPSRPPSSSRASLVITTGLPPRAAPVVRGRPQACVGGRPETPRAPGRAPGSRVQAALQAAPLTPVGACRSLPRSPRREPRPAPGSRSTRRLPQHTLIQSHQSRAAAGAATPARARRPPSAAPPRRPGVPSAPAPLTDPAAQALQHSDLTTVLVSRLGFCGARDGRRLGRSRRSRRCRRHGAARPLPQPYRLRSPARRSRSEA